MSYESNNQRKWREEDEVDAKTFGYTFVVFAGLALGTYMLLSYVHNPKIFDNNDRSFTNRLERVIR